MPANLDIENTKSHTENREKRFTAPADTELSRFSQCPSVNSVLNSEIVNIPKGYRKQPTPNVNA